MEMLGRVDPAAQHSHELFEALLRVRPYSAFEAVALRRCYYAGGRSRATRIEVFMALRPDNDPHYGGMWHCPGSIYRFREDHRAVVSRLSRSEFGVEISDFTLASDHFIDDDRGWGHPHVFLVTLAGHPQKGKTARWWPVGELPENTVAHHVSDVIPGAMRFFRGLDEAQQKALLGKLYYTSKSD